MLRVFVDSSYLIALANPRDSLHRLAQRLAVDYSDARMVTTSLVLAELCNMVGGGGAHLRAQAVQLARAFCSGHSWMLLGIHDALFDGALSLYESRPDKHWSLTDCASFLVMERLGIREALTYDLHFEQAGFKALLRQT